jgi:hypothetical protein
MHIRMFRCNGKLCDNGERDNSNNSYKPQFDLPLVPRVTLHDFNSYFYFAISVPLFSLCIMHLDLNLNIFQ